MKMVLIQWDDASSASPSWVDRGDFDDLGITNCVSVGIVLGETNKEIFLVLSLNSRNRSQAVAIPKGCIKKIWQVGVVKALDELGK